MADNTSNKINIERRHFLRTLALAGGGFVVGFSASPFAETSASEANILHSFNAFIKVKPDNTITVVIKHLDKGQGVTTGLTSIVAEEMNARWAQMRWEFAPADGSRYNNLSWGSVQGTGGSSSIRNSWLQLREAGALAKTMLVDAAAAKWQVERARISVADGIVRLDKTHFFTFGELARSAATVSPSAILPLKEIDQFNLIGTKLPRIDSKEKSTGLATYTIDLQLPNMLNAAVIHAPLFGQRLKSFDATKANALHGVVAVLEISSGLAIVADTFWTALKAKNLITTEWDESTGEKRGSEQITAALREKIAQPGVVAATRGNVNKAFDVAASIIEADFEFPYLAHASMEPLNAVVQVTDLGCEIWTACQSQTRDQMAVAEMLGMATNQVKINTQLAGGSFGRRAVPNSDFVVEAVEIAKTLGRPVPIKVQWTREDDMRGGRYRPASLHRMKASLDQDGNITAWHHRVVGQSFLKGTAFESMIKDGVDGTLLEGARGLPYAIENLHVDTHLVDNGVPTLWWRSVGHSHNGFATEVFLDDLAVAAKRDPIEVRRALLKDHPRHLGVLNLAVEKAGAAPTGKNQGRGVAVHESFRSFVAQVVDLSLGEDGDFKVDRVVCAVDCGIAINPDIIAAQIEGGIGYGLSAMLREAVTLVAGRVSQGNFDTYKPLRINEMPKVEVHIVASTEAPTGVGEPGLPPLAPAVANALRQVTGKALRKLPFQRTS